MNVNNSNLVESVKDNPAEFAQSVMSEFVFAVGLLVTTFVAVGVVFGSGAVFGSVLALLIAGVHHLADEMTVRERFELSLLTVAFVGFGFMLFITVNTAQYLLIPLTVVIVGAVLFTRYYDR